MAKRNQFDEGFFAGLTAALIVLLHSHGEESYARHIIEASVNPAERATNTQGEYMIIRHVITGNLLDIAWRKNGSFNLSEADLSGANLREADLRGADLRGAVLSGANLREANLRGADLYGADLRGADLRGANLRGADLRGADLRGADLYLANLSRADLREAVLSGAVLYLANLSGADLRGANMYVLGQCDRGYTFLLRVHGQPRIQAGCHSFTLAEARTHWEAAHDDDPVLRAQCLGFVATAEAIVAALAQNQ